MKLIVLLGCGIIFRYSPRASLLKSQGSTLHFHVACLTPILTPRITNHPIKAFLCVRAPPDHRYHMVNAFALLGGDASRVVFQGSGIDSASNGAACKNLFH